MNGTPPHPMEPDAATRPAGVGRSIFLVLLLIGLLCGALLTPLPFHDRLGSAAGDLLHAPAFAVLAFCLVRVARRLRMGRTSAALAVWLSLVAFGVASEVAQGFVGRGASVQDAVDDALGAAGGVLIGMALQGASRERKAAGIMLGLAIVLAAELEPLATIWDCYQQGREMPLLASFEHAREIRRWRAQEAELKRVAAHSSDGQWALQVDLRRGKYPGVGLHEPPADWSAYRELVFDIDLAPGTATAAPLELIVKIEDLDHNGKYHDRFHKSLRLPPGRHEIRIPLADVAAAPRGRSMDLARIGMLQWFAVNLTEPRTFYLDNVRLK